MYSALKPAHTAKVLRIHIHGTIDCSIRRLPLHHHVIMAQHPGKIRIFGVRTLSYNERQLYLAVYLYSCAVLNYRGIRLCYLFYIFISILLTIDHKIPVIRNRRAGLHQQNGDHGHAGK